MSAGAGDGADGHGDEVRDRLAEEGDRVVLDRGAPLPEVVGIVDENQVIERKILDAWLDAPFDGGRHERRIEKI